MDILRSPCNTRTHMHYIHCILLTRNPSLDTVIRKLVIQKDLLFECIYVCWAMKLQNQTDLTLIWNNNKNLFLNQNKIKLRLLLYVHSFRKLQIFVVTRKYEFAANNILLFNSVSYVERNVSCYVTSGRHNFVSTTGCIHFV